MSKKSAAAQKEKTICLALGCRQMATVDRILCQSHWESVPEELQRRTRAAAADLKSDAYRDALIEVLRLMTKRGVQSRETT